MSIISRINIPPSSPHHLYQRVSMLQWHTSSISIHFQIFTTTFYFLPFNHKFHHFHSISSLTIQSHVHTDFDLRKCCNVDQVYHLGHGIEHCTNISNDRWVSSFYRTKNNSVVVSGLPPNCSENNRMLLRPGEMTADQFFLLPDGHLVLAHRFWIISPNDLCMDYFILADNTTQVSRISS